MSDTRTSKTCLTVQWLSVDKKCIILKGTKCKISLSIQVLGTLPEESMGADTFPQKETSSLSLAVQT